jgi:dipeptidyl-peptidase-4
MNNRCMGNVLSRVLAFAMLATMARGEEANVQDDFLERYAETYRFTHGLPAAVSLTPDADAVLFLRSGPRSFVRDLYAFDPQTGAERVLVTAETLLGGGTEELTAEEKARRERMRLAARGIASYETSQDGSKLLVPLSGRLFVVDRVSAAVNELKSDAGYPIDPQFSPDGKLVACVREGDLYVIDIATGKETRLTTGATETLTHGLAEFVAQEEMGRMHGYWWSPDSRSIAYEESDVANVEELFISDPANPDAPPERWRYPRPGKQNAVVRLGVIDATGGETRWVNWDREAFPYLAAAVWDKGAPLTVVVQNRRQTEQLVLAVDEETGETRELLREKDEAWLNLDESLPRWIQDGKAFLWSSERDGAWQLELRDPDGKLLGALTKPELGYRGVVALPEGGKEAIISASEIPTEQHLYRISLDPAQASATRITEGAGLHTGWWSERGGRSVRLRTGLAGDRRFEVFDRDGKLTGELPQKAESPGFVPNVELTQVGAAPALNAAIVRPRTFDAARKYPVIVSVYGGPHAQTVIANSGKYLLDQWIADHGYIVVSIDGRGTPARGRAFERAIRGDFISLPLTDQVRGLQALAEKYPQLDLNRVGIYGWSFGGYFTAMALLQRPDVFHAGVAGAPVVDWADYDTHYTERYLGLPEENAEGYRVSNVLSYADKLDGKLLLVHGTADDNVYFLHSVKLVDALFRAGQDFEFLPLRGLTHMTPDPLVTRRLYGRMMEHFERHVAGRAAKD